MSQTFDEGQHPREGDGTFATKPRLRPDEAQTGRLRDAAAAVHGQPAPFELVRTTTDRARVEHLGGGLVLVDFRPHGGGDAGSRDASRRADAWITTAAEVEQADGDLDLLLEAGDRFSYLDPAAPDIFGDVPLEVVQEEYGPGGGRQSVLLWGERLKSAVRSDFDANRVFRLDSYDYALLAPGDPRPLNRVMRVDYCEGVTARRYDLVEAERLLSAHPWVVRRTYRRGRPGPHDHVPDGFDVDLKVPDGTWNALVEHATARAGTEDASRRPGRSKSAPRLDGLFTAVPYASTPRTSPPFWCAEVGADPLGLAPALRKTPYQEPDDEDSY